MDFIDLLEQYRVPHHTAGTATRRGWVNFRCPYCERDPYMGYHLGGRYVHCWNCGRHPLWEVIHLLTLLPARKCWDIVRDLPRERAFVELEHRAGKLHLPEGVGPLTVHHREFLRGRGFLPSQVTARWDVAGIGQCGTHAWRLYIPIHLGGRVVSWTTRSVGVRGPKYLSATAEQSVVPVEELIYGIDLCSVVVLVVEGPLDVWTVGPGAAGLLGMRVSPAQLRQLARFSVRYVCLDNEPAAQRRARKLCNDLSAFPGVTTNVVLETGKDASRAALHEQDALRRLLQ